jgi:DNA gyrase/topoisomerase IV subunit A
MTEKNYNQSDKSVKDSKTAEDFILFKTKAKSNMTLLAFTNLGNCVKINLDTAQECRFRDKGPKFTSVQSDMVKGEHPVSFIAVDENKMSDGFLLFYTKNGLVKKAPYSEYTVQKSYYQAINLKDGDELIGVEENIPETNLAYITKDGIVLICEKEDMPIQKRNAGGVKGLKVSSNDEIIFVSQVDEEGEFVIITDGGFYKRVLISEIEVYQMNRKGIKIVTLGKTDKVVYADVVKHPYDIAVIDNFGVVFSVNTEEISIEDRVTKGKTLKTVNKKRKPEFAFKI